MDHKKSLYTRDDRKHIVQLIENLKNNKDYVKIFEILTDDAANSYTHNSNGVFLNLSAVSDATLDRINKYITKINKQRSNEIEIDVDLIANGNNNKMDRTHKLSNYEKNIIKQRNLKKVLNDDTEYQELELTASNSKNESSTTTKKINKNKKTSKNTYA